MPFAMRSPPPQKSTISLHETQSEPDLNISDKMDCITTRQSNKRFRGDDDCTDIDRFEDLKNMLQSWKEDQDVVLKKIVAEVSELKQQNLNIQKSYSEIEHSIQLFNLGYEEMKSRLECLELAHKDNTKRLNDLSNSVNAQAVSKLEAKIEAMEQQARSCNLEICNLPEKRNENLFAIVDSIGCAINVPVSHNDIMSIHRVPHAQQHDRKPKNIIIKFRTRIIRDNILSAYRQKKGLTSDQLGISGASLNIYFNEHLTLHNKALFREAKKIANEIGFKYVWVRNGTVLVRERDGLSSIAIRSKEDLKRIVIKEKKCTENSNS
uniref:SFRICE_036806 n=1 Tax=Spodoptera frugiperda TaxID=7108 RepID=A0A2H1X1G7_SPOFR